MIIPAVPGSCFRSASLSSWLTCFLLAFLLVGFQAAAALGLEIRFLEEATVTGSQVLLRDIAAISPDNALAQSLGKRIVSAAPRPGGSKTLKTAAIQSYLELTENLTDAQWQGPATITLQRRGLELGPEQISQIIAEYLQKNLERLPRADIRFVPGTMPRPVTLPFGKLSWEVIPSNPDILGSSSFSVILKVDGKTVENMTVRGKLEAWADVVIATRSIKKGSRIASDQLGLRRMDISRLQDPITTREKIIGLIAKQTLHAGRAIEKRHVKLPPHIKKGDQVKIVAHKGSLNISTMGIAMADGRRGDMIRVRNIQSNKLIYCLVAAPGLVTVSF